VSSSSRCRCVQSSPNSFSQKLRDFDCAGRDHPIARVEFYVLHGGPITQTSFAVLVPRINDGWHSVPAANGH